MCYSSEVSLLTLIVGLLGSTAVYTLGSTFDKIIGLYLGYVSLMQGIEWILWNNQKCDSFHKKVSILGMLLNFSQPIILGLLILLFSDRIQHKTTIISIMVAYIIYMLIYSSNYTKNLQCTNPRPNDPHLVWNWTILPFYYIGWFVYIFTVVVISVLGMPTLNQGIFFAGLAFTSMLVSILVYPRQDMGAMWCFFTAYSPFLYYFFRTILNKRIP
jgi:hypothetical protein